MHLLVFFSLCLRTGIVCRLATISFLLFYFGVLSVYGVQWFDVMLCAAKPSNFVLRCIVYLAVLCHQFQILPKSVVRACADFVYCWAYCLSYSWRLSGLRRENKTDNMPTSKRKMNGERWKQPKIIGQLSNDRLGFNYYLQLHCNAPFLRLFVFIVKQNWIWKDIPAL